MHAFFRVTEVSHCQSGFSRSQVLVALAYEDRSVFCFFFSQFSVHEKKD